MRNDLVDDVLDGGFFWVTELEAALADLLDLIFQKLYEVAVLVGRHQGNRPHEAVPSLPSLCERVGKVWKPLVELLGRFVNGIRGRI